MLTRLPRARAWVVEFLPVLGVVLLVLGAVAILLGLRVPEPWRGIAQATCLAGLLSSVWRMDGDQETRLFGAQVLDDTQGRVFNSAMAVACISWLFG